MGDIRGTKLGRRTHLVAVGGFLGAGKTTLLAHAATHIAQRGLRVGLVTNDQAMALVDTALLRSQGFHVGEVGAGCFCCRFEELMDAAQKLDSQIQPEVLLCEPVGSCTDLVATVLRPLEELHGDIYTVGPFSVLVDPMRLEELFAHENARRYPETVTYILRKQLEEADLVLLSKSDCHSTDALDRLAAELTKHVPEVSIERVSARSGLGMDAWVERILTPGGARRTLDIDYDTYAAGEAALGWLNATIHLRAANAADWAAVCRQLLLDVREEVQAAGGQIAHIKLFLARPAASLSGNLTSTDEAPLIQGSMESSGGEADLNLNARVVLDAATLRTSVERVLSRLGRFGISSRVTHMEAFAPARPTPLHRFPAAGA